MNGLGFTYTENQANAFTLNAKLRYDISGEDQVSYGYRASLNSSHGYNASYKYRADSSSLGSGYSIQNNLGWTHFFAGGKTFLKAYLAKLETKDGNDIAGTAPPAYSGAYENLDVNDDKFIDVSTGQRWYNLESRVWSSRLDFNSQVHPLHMLKTGFELNFEEINSTEISRPTAPLPDSTGALTPAPYPGKVETDHGDYPGYGQYRAYMNNLPNRGRVFIQDNIEFSGRAPGLRPRLHRAMGSRDTDDRPVGGTRSERGGRAGGLQEADERELVPLLLDARQFQPPTLHRLSGDRQDRVLLQLRPLPPVP
jgi:hypothetical protein